MASSASTSSAKSESESLGNARSRKRSKDSTGSGSSQESQLSKVSRIDCLCSSEPVNEFAEAERDRLTDIMKEELEPVPFVFTCYDYFAWKPKFKNVDEKILTEQVEKMKENYKDLFEKIKKCEKESVLQGLFASFFEELFRDSELLSATNTSSNTLPFVNGLETSSGRKPDLTITLKVIHMEPVEIYAVLYGIIKPDLLKNSNLEEYRAFGQVRHHAKNLLTGDGYIVPRESVLGFISDGIHFDLYRFFVTEDNQFRHMRFPLTRNKAFDVFIKMAHFYEFKRPEMMIDFQDNTKIDFIEPQKLKLIKILHRNELSAVYHFEGISGVFKMNGSPKYQASIKHEKEIYSKLWEKNKDLQILTVLGFYESEQLKRCAILFEEQGTCLNSIRGLHGIIPVLKTLHQLGYAHRDVRPANFLRVSRNGKLQTFLIDFNFACALSVPASYSGTWETASDSVLVQLMQCKKDISIVASDDLESLLKTYILLYFKPEYFWNAIRDLLTNRNRKTAKDIYEAWQKIRKLPAVELIFGTLWKMAKDCEYDKLIEKMKEIEISSFLPDPQQ